MAPRTTFASLSAGLQSLGLWDSAISDTAKLGVIPCSASGANDIALTPLSDAFPPTLIAYADHLLFSFPAAAASTGAVTINVNSIGAKNLYRQDGTTAVGSGELAQNTLYLVAYSSALHSSAGGFYLVGSRIGFPTSSTDNVVPRFNGTGGDLQTSGTLIDDSNNISPVTTDTGALGTASLMWADLFLASGGVINWNNGDVTATHAANSLTFAGATSGYLFDNALLPTANDGAAIGSGTASFSDVFLASGAVINFNNGDVTLTHSANGLAFAGASSGYTFDAVLAPATNDAAALGTTSLGFSDLHLATGGVVNWNNGDVAITHGANTLVFSGGASGYQYDAALLPTANDGAALGASGTAWADLFLASGGVINFNAGDISVTHSTNTLTFTGASSGYRFDNDILPNVNDTATLGNSSLRFSDLFLASGAVINFNASDVTITHSANTLAFAGATSGYTFDVPINLASGGTGSALVDPGADRFMFWDESANAVAFLTPLGGATIDTTNLRINESIIIAIGDETSTITTGTAKVTFRMPYAFTLTSVRASLTTVSSSGNPTFDINEGGTTILSTKLSIDANEKTSTTATTAAVISDASLADDAEITIDVDTAGTGAAGAKIYLIGYRP